MMYDVPCSYATFVIVDSLPDVGEPGTIYVNDTNTYMYTEELGWQNIGQTDVDIVGVDLSLDKLPTNCKNCGAVLKGHVCEYCGTRY